MEFKRQAKLLRERVEIIPLLDIVLLLLLLFLLSAYSIPKTTVLVDLPPVRADDIQRGFHPTVVISKSGHVFFNGRRVDLPDGLIFGLKLARKKEQNPLLILKVDNEVPYSEVVRIMELAKECGIKRIGTAAREEK